ncbi:MAG: DNA methyltransferase, partial [Patescibacteria group bacterium]
PFAGSGTVGRAAINLNRHFFLTEKESRYVNRMKEDVIKKDNLFNLKTHQPNFVDINNFIILTKGKI